LLSGLRVAIKDNFHIRGTKTSPSNRVFFRAVSRAGRIRGRDPQTAGSRRQHRGQDPSQLLSHEGAPHAERRLPGSVQPSGQRIPDNGGGAAEGAQPPSPRMSGWILPFAAIVRTYLPASGVTPLLFVLGHRSSSNFFWGWGQTPTPAQLDGAAHRHSRAQIQGRVPRQREPRGTWVCGRLFYLRFWARLSWLYLIGFLKDTLPYHT